MTKRHWQQNKSAIKLLVEFWSDKHGINREWEWARVTFLRLLVVMITESICVRNTCVRISIHISMHQSKNKYHLLSMNDSANFVGFFFIVCSHSWALAANTIIVTNLNFCFMISQKRQTNQRNVEKTNKSKIKQKKRTKYQFGRENLKIICPK